MTSPDPRRHRPTRSVLIILLVLALWGATPPWTGPPLDLGISNVPFETEVVTHAVPAAILVVITIAGLLGRLPLPSALLAVLMGLWMASTHAPLVARGLDGRVAMDAALFHSLPGFTILALSIALAVSAWRQEIHALTQQRQRRRSAR